MQLSRLRMQLVVEHEPAPSALDVADDEQEVVLTEPRATRSSQEGQVLPQRRAEPPSGSTLPSPFATPRPAKLAVWESNAPGASSDT